MSRPQRVGPAGTGRTHAPCGACGRHRRIPWWAASHGMRCRRRPGVCDRESVQLKQSRKLENVLYDIRGPVLDEAKRLEEEGRRIIKLNIGNPGAFGFDAPEEILVEVTRSLSASQGYSDSQGLLSARIAVVQHYQE